MAQSPRVWERSKDPRSRGLWERSGKKCSLEARVARKVDLQVVKVRTTGDEAQSGVLMELRTGKKLSSGVLLCTGSIMAWINVRADKPLSALQERSHTNSESCTRLANMAANMAANITNANYFNLFSA